MILIKNVEYLSVESDQVELAMSRGIPNVIEVIDKFGNRSLVPDTIIREMVRGTRFRKPNGEELVVGMSADVQNLIGIHFDTYHTMNEAVGRLTMGMINLQDKLSKMRNAKWWTRLKWVFIKP